MAIRLLTTHAQVVEALGGPKAFAQLISTPEKQFKANHINNYLRDEFFPAKTFQVVTKALVELGYTVPDLMKRPRPDRVLFKEMILPKSKIAAPLKRAS